MGRYMRLFRRPELGALAGVPTRGAAAAHDGLDNGRAGDGENDLFIAPYQLPAVGGLGHGVGSHVGVIGEVDPPGDRGQVGGAVWHLGLV